MRLAPSYRLPAPPRVERSGPWHPRRAAIGAPPRQRTCCALGPPAEDMGVLRSAQVLQNQLATIPRPLSRLSEGMGRWRAYRALGRYIEAELRLRIAISRDNPRLEMKVMQSLAEAAGKARAALEAADTAQAQERALFLLLLFDRRTLIDGYLNEQDAAFRLNACDHPHIDHFGRVLAAAQTWHPPGGLNHLLRQLSFLRAGEQRLARLHTSASFLHSLDPAFAWLRLHLVVRCLRLSHAAHDGLLNSGPAPHWSPHGRAWRQRLGPAGEQLIGALADESAALACREKTLRAIVARGVGGSRRP